MKRFLLAAMLLFLCFSSFAQKRKRVHYTVYNDYHAVMVPDFDTLGKPDFKGRTNNFAWFGVPGATCAHFAGTLEGKLRVKKAETYTFHFAVDDGGLFYVDGKKVVDMDGRHGIQSREAEVFLEKGRHDLRIEYFNYDKAFQVKFLYSTPTIPQRPYYTMGDCIPKFVYRDARKTYRRYRQWKGSDETIVFPLITDVHTASNEKYRHVGYLAETDRIFHYDFMANLGDIGLNDPMTNKSEEAARETVDKIRTEMEKYPGVYLFAPGNHDWDGGAGTHISSARLSAWFQQPYVGKSGGRLHIAEGKCYGYYDLTEKNTRFILLNSQGTESMDGYYVYDEAQLEWLKELLQSTPRTMNVVVMSHLCPMPMGRWYVNGKLPETFYEGRGSEELHRMLSEYKARGGKLIAVLCGDSHVNAREVYDGIPYYISQGYGGDMGAESMQSCQRRAWPDYTGTLCCDIIAIKPATGEMHSFRMGGGGASMDYVIAE